MANMFELSVGTCNQALEIEPNYIDALVSRAGSNIVLGKYADAGTDYDRILQLDHHDIFTDVYPNISRILVTKTKKDNDGIFPGGWDRVVESLDRLIPKMEEKRDAVQQQSVVSSITNTLKVLHLE